MSWSWGYKPTRPLATNEGIQARSKQGGFVKHWWASRWIQALAETMDTGRLARGKNYARRGQVLRLERSKWGFEAEVLGSRPDPYRQRVEVTRLRDAAAAKVAAGLAAEPGMVALLLAGEMPEEIESVFEAAGARLFPEHEEDLDMDCDCPDWEPLCKHLAAVFHLIGERLDDDPFLLFQLRGRDREGLLDEIRSLRDGADEGASLSELSDESEEAPALEDMLEDFWRAGRGLSSTHAHPREASVELPVLRRLGQPSFTKRDLEAVLGPAVRRVAGLALGLAFDGEAKADDGAVAAELDA